MPKKFRDPFYKRSQIKPVKRFYASASKESGRRSDNVNHNLVNTFRECRQKELDILNSVGRAGEPPERHYPKSFFITPKKEGEGEE